MAGRERCVSNRRSVADMRQPERDTQGSGRGTRGDRGSRRHNQTVRDPNELRRISLSGFGFNKSHELVQQLKDHVTRELGKIAVSKEIEIVTSLPKTRSGKIMRRVLKAKKLGQNPGDISTLEE